MLPIQSAFDVATAEGDTVLIPQSHFTQLFDEFRGGVLAIRIRLDETYIYTSCSPQNEDNDVYMPDWLYSVLCEKTATYDEFLMVDVEAAPPVPYARTIRVRRATMELEVDIHELLQQFLYDCKYIQPNTVFHIPFAGTIVDLIVEAVIDEEGFEMEVGQLGAEVNMDIQEPVSTPPPPSPPPVPEDPVSVPAPIHSTEELRRIRLAYFSSRGGGPANVANCSGQYTGAGNS